MVSPSFPAYGLGFSGKPEGYETSKGKINKTYLKFGEVAQVPTLTFHELNHSLFGLPDLYNHPAATVGKPKYLATAGWGIMSNLGNYAKNYFAWEKYLSGWLSSDQVKCVSAKTKIKVTLSPQADSSAGVKMLVVKVSETKALVVEYRVPGLGFDGMNVKQGALVYLVDGAIESGKDPVKVLTKPDITTLKNKESIKYSNVKITQISGNNSGITIQIN
jgi:M6 family metalloprotease-like protein